MNSSVFFALLLVLSLLIENVHAEVIELHVPFIEDSPKQHLYFHELLSEALEEAGHTPKLVIYALPQLRAKSYFDSGKLSIYWMLENAERNQKYIPIDVDLTDGLIGKRLLFIKKGDQKLYDQVQTLGDFQKLNVIGGMGKGWFDSKVWAANGLQYKEQEGNWEVIFRKIPHGRDYNYFPRGLNEILVESKQYPELDIEQRLVLIYKRDYRFYLSKKGPYAGIRHKDIIDSAMKKARYSGLIQRYVRKYWASDFEKLNYNERIKIHLHTPK